MKTNGGTKLVGYSDRLSVAAGDRQRFMISTDPPGPYRANLVRVVCGDSRPQGAGFREEPVEWLGAGEYQGVHQRIDPGSYGESAHVPALGKGTVSLYFMPTRFGKPGTLVDVPDSGIAIVVCALGRLHVTKRVSPVEASSIGRPLLDMPAVALNRWHWLSVRFEGRRVESTLIRYPNNAGESTLEQSAATELDRPLSISQSVWLFAASAACDAQHQVVHERFFNGRIELPWIANERIEAKEAIRLSEDPRRLAADPRLVAAWDFSMEMSGQRFLDISANNLHGRFVNTPTRAVRGVRWDGCEHDWKRAPQQYGSVHFHDDDLTDAQWRHAIEWQVPASLRSGVYAVKLTRGVDDGYITFFVRPSPSHTKAKAVFVASTATYLAYANDRFSMYAALLNDGVLVDPVDAYLHGNSQVGYSMYERHGDGSGVHYSSHLRPVLNLQPGGRMWSFNADTNITAWLDHLGVEFDVVTDEDLHRDGAKLLDGYSVVITGTHPEYASTRMLDGIAEYLQRGGRLMYMGGNGFYWRVAFDPHNPSVIELRRAEGYGAAWDCQPGEYYHAFTGEYGGLWRRLGRAPNRLLGVGFVALAGDGATFYQRQPGADDPRVSFIFEGTSEGAAFGRYGSISGGAVSQEIDRWNPLLGSAPHALVLASSAEQPADFMLTKDEVVASYPGLEGPRLRADMTFFETPAGGAVFATGSIGFAAALAHSGYANDVHRIASNVLDRFLDVTPFAMPSDE